MLIKCMEVYASMPDLFKVASLTTMIVKSTTTDLGLEPIAMYTFWYYVMHEKGF